RRSWLRRFHRKRRSKYAAPSPGDFCADAGKTVVGRDTRESLSPVDEGAPSRIGQLMLTPNSLRKIQTVPSSQSFRVVSYGSSCGLKSNVSTYSPFYWRSF